MADTLDGWTITAIRHDTYRPAFGGEPVAMTLATLRHAHGETIHLSHRVDDPEGAWGIDAAFGANGMPHWCNGDGAREIRVRRAGPEIENWLTLAALVSGAPIGS